MFFLVDIKGKSKSELILVSIFLQEGEMSCFKMLRLKILIALMLCMLVLFPVSAQEHSVDAIAVWECDPDWEVENDEVIKYSFYGHTPAVPKPVGNITE